jgi:CubicO group peptidase (beta-lactamase class C family)
VDETDPITSILREGIRTRVFPGAVLFVRHKGQIGVHQAIGLTSSHPNSPPVQINTIYDLASLTKPLATASSILLLVQEGRVSLTQNLATLLEETKGVPLGQASLRDLLSHQSGLPAWRPFYQSFPPTFSSEPDFRQKRTQAVLEMILQEPIDRIAPSEEDPWRGRLLQGEVHDENAAALAGVAGHAGLFGTAQAVGQITKAWLDSYAGKPSLFQCDVVRQFVKAQPGSWGLGWDTPSQPSSSGQWFLPESFGHLGFTGTSIWIDPVRELEVIFLSNRVHSTRDNQAIKTFRPKLHDVIIQGL